MRQVGQVNNASINQMDVYCLIGDSNQNGAAFEPAGMDAKYFNPYSALIYYKPDRTSTDNGAIETFSNRPNSNRAPGSARQTSGPWAIGPETSFAYRLGELSKKKVGIVKLGVGGSSLIAQASTDNEWQKSAGELYTVFVEYFYKMFMQKAHVAGYRNINVKGIIIRLGTNDCSNTMWNQANFTAAIPLFVANLRADMNQPNLPVYWVLPRTDLGSVANYTQANVDACRSAITTAAAANNFSTISYAADALGVDGVHFTGDSYLTQGTSEANTLYTV